MPELDDGVPRREDGLGREAMEHKDHAQNASPDPTAQYLNAIYSVADYSIYLRYLYVVGRSLR